LQLFGRFRHDGVLQIQGGSCISHFGLARLDNLSYKPLMTSTNTTWMQIEAIAERLGVKPEARRKWRERGSVPHRWRLPILQAGAGIISADDFSAADGKTGRAA
jgi:hypothetical protein